MTNIKSITATFLLVGKIKRNFNALAAVIKTNSKTFELLSGAAIRGLIKPIYSGKSAAANGQSSPVSCMCVYTRISTYTHFLCSLILSQREFLFRACVYYTALLFQRATTIAGFLLSVRRFFASRRGEKPRGLSL